MAGEKIKLSDIKEHISCYLCKNYLVEATTIIECLHTFCKTCIVKYLNDPNNTYTCPKCENVIHQSHPLQYISFDRTMQDIVDKLLSPPKSNTNGKDLKKETNNNATPTDGTNKLKPIDTNCQGDFHREDEQINLVLTPEPSSGLKSIRFKYIRISCLATITHLKKFVALKIFGDMERFKEVNILCNDNLQGKDYTIKFVAATYWRNKVPPVELTYNKNEVANSY